MRAALAALCVALAAPVAAAQPAALFVGDWAGKGETLAWNDNFRMTLHIAPDGSGSLVYFGASDDYRCDASWALNRRAPRKLDYRENVLTGPCENGGSVTLTPNGAGLDFVWTLRFEGRTVRAVGKFWREPVLSS